MAKLVFFDLDGTLIDNPSSEIQFFFFLLKKRYFGWKQLCACVLFFFRWLWHFKGEIFIKNKAYFYGLSVDEITQIAVQFTEQKLLPTVRPQIKKILDEHRQNKDNIVLLTGAPEFVANVFAEYFGVSDLYATKIDNDKGYFTNAPLLQHPYALEKLKIAYKACDKYQVKIADTIAYANSIHDYALLNACGMPIVVTPDKKLRHVAEIRNWTIID